ncbi:hypothetical protein [Paenibacillus sp. FSL H3-0333]|uniref:hypothetical protein n=1 Tax=Paenibacillus sp. FSL H3-0333 TaxID=2921373 RepID=UPI0030F4F0CF
MNNEEKPLLTLDETIVCLKTMVNPETDDDIKISFEEFLAIESCIEYLIKYKNRQFEKPV